jgi:branched-subunit amino acid aminotransferase/4-amino-4-deoxychorismate lyase
VGEGAAAARRDRRTRARGGAQLILALAVSGQGLVDPHEPVVHVDDEAFMRGRGAFETLRIYGGTPFRLGDHLDRLDASCARLGFAPPSRTTIEELVAVVVDRAPDAMLRVYATPGRGDGPQALAVVSELPVDLGDLRGRGIDLISVEFRPADLIGGVKSTSYALNMMAVDAAKARGADDALFVGEGGIVLEATTSNVWWRRGETLFTPSLELGILAGVTRDVMRELAPSLGYDVREGIWTVDELAAADEAFTSSSVREVMPAVSLDGRPVGDRKPGEAAARLQATLREQACP